MKQIPILGTPISCQVIGTSTFTHPFVQYTVDILCVSKFSVCILSYYYSNKQVNEYMSIFRDTCIYLEIGLYLNKNI